MHRCFGIVEVQRSIFDEVYHQPRGQETLAKLARTCHAFSSAALDTLWAELDSFEYIIRCLPRDLWKMEVADNYLTFQRPMLLNDWEIFFKYSSRIRTLGQPYFVSAYLAQSMNLGDDVIFALSNPPSYRPLIPHLKTLYWCHSNKRHASLLRLLMTPCLVNLSLSLFTLRAPEISIMTSIGTVCTSLKSLRITSREPFSNFLDAKSGKVLSEVVPHLRSLEILRCPALDEAAIIHLSRLPRLAELSLELQPGFQLEKVRLVVNPPAFASVKSLTIHAHALSTLTSLLEPMGLTPGKVSFVVASTPTPDALRLFFITLVGACDSEKLVHISLTTSNRRQRGVATRQITLSTFQPLLALPNIESFEFDAPCDIAFDDDAITTLSKHWPKLESLSFNAKCGWGIISGVTHRGLITLLSHCEALYKVALAVDFIEVDGFDVEVPYERIGNGFYTLECVSANFVTSSIRFPVKIAAFLSDVCPGMETVMSSWDGTATIGMQVSSEEIESYREKWMEVERLLPAFSAVRAQCV